MPKSIRYYVTCPSCDLETFSGIASVPNGFTINNSITHCRHCSAKITFSTPDIHPEKETT